MKQFWCLAGSTVPQTITVYADIFVESTDPQTFDPLTV